MLSTAVSAPQEFIPPLSLSPEAERDLRNMFQKCRTEGEISRVIEGAKSGWKGFFKPYPLNPRLCIQAHTIRGLKVYRDAQHELVADLALGQKWEETDRQGSRRVKEVCKICDGTVQHMVRYSSSYKSHGDNDPSNFSLYIKNELEVRQQLGSIAHLLPLFHLSLIHI